MFCAYLCVVDSRAFCTSLVYSTKKDERKKKFKKKDHDNKSRKKSASLVHEKVIKEEKRLTWNQTFKVGGEGRRNKKVFDCFKMGKLSFTKVS